MASMYKNTVKTPQKTHALVMVVGAKPKTALEAAIAGRRQIVFSSAALRDEWHERRSRFFQSSHLPD